MKKCYLLVIHNIETMENQQNLQTSIALFQYFSVSLFIFCVFFILLLFYYSCPNFSPVALPCPAHSLSQGQSPLCCPCPWTIHTRSLTGPFPFFPPFSPSPLPLVTVGLFLVSMPLVVFCLFFANQ